MATTTKTKAFKPEDYSRFLIREFLKKNGFPKTYDSFIEEDTREKVTMTKNELTRLLGIDVLMKRNAKSKVFNTMLDIICDFLMISKEATSGVGVSYPKVAGGIPITESNFTSPDKAGRGGNESNLNNKSNNHDFSNNMMKPVSNIPRP